MRENHSRSIIKAVTYRTTATLATFALAYAFTGDLEIAGKIGFLDFFVKFTIYYLNERLWNRTEWGYQGAKSLKSTKQHDYVSEESTLRRAQR